MQIKLKNKLIVNDKMNKNKILNIYNILPFSFNNEFVGQKIKQKILRITKQVWEKVKPI